MNRAKKILIALQDHLNVNSFKALAEVLGISESLLYSWVRHNKISGTGKILSKLPYINLEWLETGNGPMAILDKDNFHLIPNSKWAEESMEPPPVSPSKIVAQIHPGKAEVKERLLVERKQDQPPPEAEADDIEELKRMSDRVLRSKTVYRSAWASNCRAFYQAVIKEEEMKTTNERLDAMTAEMAELKELIKSLLGPDQKRGQKAG